MGNGGGGHTTRSDADPPPHCSGPRGRQEGRLAEQRFHAPRPWRVQGEHPQPTAAHSVGVPPSRLSPCTITVRGLNSCSDLSFWGVGPMQL